MTEPLNNIDTELDEFLTWVMANRDVPSRKWVDEIEPELIRQIQALLNKSVLEARKETIDYFYWRIDCSTLISELEGWRGCVENAKDQTERHFAQLRQITEQENK